MTFRNKILFSIWGVVLSLLVITLVLINFWTRGRITNMLVTELRTGVATVQVHEQLQSAQMIRSCIVVAESPRLRAVAELGDLRTASQLMQELSSTTQSQVFVLTDRTGKILAQIFQGKQDTWDISNRRTLDEALAYRSSTDVWIVHDGIYRIVTVPILVETDLVGTLSMGYPITEPDLASLKLATNCDIAMVGDGHLFGTTFDRVEAEALMRSTRDNMPMAESPRPGGQDPGIERATAVETYITDIYMLSRDTTANASGVFYLVMKPLSREVREAMGSMLKNFGVLSLFFLILTTVIGLVISRGMTRPIAALVTGADEIGKGNYDYVLDVHGADELVVLARRFMAMSASLKYQIAEMANLNRDLRQRNQELDDTLRQLQTAQEELVRSERLAATGKMTAQLAHEINNPIHNIQSCLQTALNRLPAGVHGKDLIEAAFGEAARLSRLTAQMLNFYRTSLVEDVMRPTDMNQLLQEVVALSRGDLDSHQIAVTTSFADDLPAVRGSRDKLKQVFLNLITNARDAMPAGGHLDILTTRNDGNVVIRVADTGVGIPEENLSRIYDAFYTTKGKVSGVGLGLSVSYGIVSQHRGAIEVQSTVGKGTTFTVVLPHEET